MVSGAIDDPSSSPAQGRYCPSPDSGYIRAAVRVGGSIGESDWMAIAERFIIDIDHFPMTKRKSSSGRQNTGGSSFGWLRRLLNFSWLRSKPRRATQVTQAATPIAGAKSAVHFSPGDACLNAIIGQIASAKKTLDICVFTISDDRIADAIVACHRSRVRVRIITDNEKIADLGSDIERFALAGMAVKVDRTEAHMHHKFALIDGATVLTGSYNWTRSAALYNEENLLVTADAEIVQAYLRGFERMWASMTAF